MHDVVLIQNFEGFNYLREIGEGDSFRERPLLFEKLFKCSSVAELVHEVEIVSSFEHIEVFDDVLAGL
jgi:hypothetical protein